MNKEYFNYGETICDAVDIIVSEKLKALSYDITKVCTIIDDTYKDFGKYTVQEETISYDAYSINTTFNKGDSVLITIPNGDYSMQKTIVSKVALDNDLTTALAYESPLKAMLSFTNNIIPETKEFSLLANDEQRKVQHICEIPWTGTNDYSDYTRMGITAEFQSWLSDLNVTSGSYGLLFYFYDNNTTAMDREARKNSIYSFVLDVNDMIGNPYDFTSYFKHEKVLDISFVQNVSVLDVYFYQNCDFKDISGNLVPYEFDDIENNDELNDDNVYIPEHQKLYDNLFVNNINIFLGYGVNEFSNDSLRLYTEDSSTYSIQDKNNNKNLTLKWIHKIDDITYEFLDTNSENIELYWVRSGYTSQPIEHIVGTGWNQSNLQTNPYDQFKCILNISNTTNTDAEIKVKVVGRIKKSDGNWMQYSSNVLTFVNTDPRVDQTTYSAATALAIHCQDKTEGNYFLYNQNSELINEGLGRGYPRAFRLLYKGESIEDSTDLKDNVQKIKWTIPTNNNNDSFTMLEWPTLTKYFKEEQMVQEADYLHITIDNPTSYELEYNIANIWYSSNSHNTIQCTLTSKSGIIYNATKELIFGKANSQGSNISLIPQIINTNAYEITTDKDNTIISEPEAISIKGLLYNLSGNMIISPAETTWYWYFEQNQDRDGNQIFEFTGEDSDQGLSQTVSIKLKSDWVNKTLPPDLHVILCVQYQQPNAQKIAAYLPIAIKTRDAKNGVRCSTIEGARKVIYNQLGQPSYYTGPYQLIGAEGNVISNNIVWDYFPKNQGQPDPVLTQMDNNVWALLANQAYIKDYKYSTTVTAMNIEGTIYWIQPVHVMQSNYDFAIVNQWTGDNTLIKDEGIVSSMLAAGRQGEDGFSGIIIGEITETVAQGDTLRNIGLYSVDKGQIAFSLTDSGLATFGKLSQDQDVNEGEGQDVNEQECLVYLGESNYIESYKNPGEGQFKHHLVVDFDDQVFKFGTEDPNKGLMKIEIDANNNVTMGVANKLTLDFNSGIITIEGKALQDYIKDIINKEYVEAIVQKYLSDNNISGGN